MIRNGECGDWQLPDALFLRGFQLPAERCGNLAQKNPFSRDRRVIFVAAQHAYFIDGVRAPISVTGFVHRFKLAFEPHTELKAMMDRNDWSARKYEYMKEDGTIKTTDEIIAAWTLHAEVQRARGTLLHYHAEQFLNGNVIEEPHSPEFKQICVFYNDIIVASGWTVYRTEAIIFHCGLRLAGQVDLLCKDLDGHLIIIDWKRARQLDYTNRYRTLKEPLNHMDDTNYSLYSLQLNLYAYILETEYGFKVSRLLLVVVHPLYKMPRCIEVPRLPDEIACLVEEEVVSGRATYPIPGEHASFCVR